ncbi:MAG TPA: serine/threonine-protein kinase [Dokdonella sp.]|nr:serine/threonine-protein kinase [Dokdonella sp.]
MNHREPDFAEVRRLFDLLSDLPAADRAARLQAEGADAEVVAEVMHLLESDGRDPAALQSKIGAQLASLPETELDAGERLGAWRLVRRIATGGMGAVYLAERADGHFEQVAALKMIRGIAGPAALEHFSRERQILASLQHLSIARLIDGGATPGGQPYLVMDYVEGEPIDAYCRSRGLDLDARLLLFLRVCEAVQFAHQRLIVHCDLKPANVLVKADGNPMLLDFGIARALGREPVAADASSAYFTPGYASPEQLRGEPLGAASDVYALGLILFELVSGRPAQTDARDDTIQLLGQGRIEPSSRAGAVSWRRRLGGDIDAIVLRATADAPADRYASVQSLAEDLRRYREHRPLAARAPTVAYRLRKLVRRRWPAFAVGLAALCMIAVFTWRVVLERDHALEAQQEAQKQAASAERTRDFLVSVFNVSNPRLGRGKDVLARDVLDEGATRIAGELGAEPEIKAVLMDTLATAYRYIGEPKRSVDLLREASALYLEPRVDDPLAAAAVLSQLAVVYANTAYPVADSLDAANRALELRRTHGADGLAMADSYNTLGVVLNSAERRDDARAALQQSLQLRQQLSTDSDEISSTLHNLGLVESASGRHDAALDYFAKALALRGANGGTQRTAYQITLESYGVALGRAGQSEKALEVLRQNQRLVQDLYGDDTRPVANASNELGSVLHDQGHFREAADYYEKSIRINRTISGSESASAAVSLNNLASAFEDMGEFDRAIPLFRESLAQRTAVLAAGDPMIIRAQHNLARALLRKGPSAEADRLIADVLEACRQRYGEDSAMTVRAQLVEILGRQRPRDAEAAAGLMQSFERHVASLSTSQHAQWEELRAQLAKLRGQARDELEHLKAAWEIQARASGDRHPFTARRALAYAAALARSGDRPAARRIADDVGAIAESALPGDQQVQETLAQLRKP